MAERNPAFPQLDFPQLVADIIRQLNLTGTVGLLNFQDSVQPVYIVASREGALAFTASAPVFTSAGISSDSNSNAPINTVLADTGALAAGDYDIFASMEANGNPGVLRLVLEHRNAANNATLAVLLHIPMGGGVDMSVRLPVMGYTLGLNERLRMINLSGAMIGSLSGVIGVQIRPTP